MLVNAKNFRTEDLPIVREHLLKLPDERFGQLCKLQFKNPNFMLLVTLWFGMFSVDRFMLRQTISALIKLLLFGGFGIWTIVDLFTVMNRTKKYNLDRLLEVF